ncbi:MAG: UPF0179 family protein, partial [Halobacteria archaeon]|nr:UPF0179 family protein [Halobacteria archaeon]
MTEAEAEKNTQITLIGTTVAESGKEFVYEGETEACEGCPHSGNCLNLDEGIRYRITDVREGGQNLDCAIHDERSVRAVEVTEPPV